MEQQSQGADPFEQFYTSEYISNEVVFPSLQAMRNQNRPRSGLLMMDSEIEKAGFEFPREGEFCPSKFERVSDAFQSGDAYEGFLLNQVMFHLLKSSGLMVFEKRGANQQDLFLGEWREFTSRNRYDPQFHYCRVRHLVMLASYDRLLHHIPFRISTKGVFSQSFGSAIGNYRGAVNDIVKKPMSAKFFSLWAIIMNFTSEMRGSGTESGLACVVNEMVLPKDRQDSLKFFRSQGTIFSQLQEAFDTYGEMNLFPELLTPESSAQSSAPPPPSAPAPISNQPPRNVPVRQVNRPQATPSTIQDEYQF